MSRPIALFLLALFCGGPANGAFETQFLDIFPGSTTFAAANGVVTTAIGDLDADGKNEVVAIDSLTNRVRVVRVSETGVVTTLLDRAIASAQGTFPTWQITSAHLVDINADGKKDIVCWSRANNQTGRLILLEQGAGFTFTESFFATPETDAAYSMALVDVNRDGLLDAVTANHGFAAVANLYVTFNATGPTRFSTSTTVGLRTCMESI